MASKVKKKPSASKQPVWFVAGISTHHLLNHKPDNLLAKGGKHGLRGWYVFGTPGLCVGFSKDSTDIEDFADTMRSAMRQKKFEVHKVASIDADAAVASAPVGWEAVADKGSLARALSAAGLGALWEAMTGLAAVGAQPGGDAASSKKRKGGKKKGKRK